MLKSPKRLQGMRAFTKPLSFLKPTERDVKQAEQSPPIVLLCLDAPPFFRNRLYTALEQVGRMAVKIIAGILTDPYRIFLAIIMAWYSWSSGLF